MKLLILDVCAAINIGNEILHGRTESVSNFKSTTIHTSFFKVPGGCELVGDNAISDTRRGLLYTTYQRNFIYVYPLPVRALYIKSIVKL